MERKSIEDNLSANIDAYLNGIEVVDGMETQESSDVFKLAKSLSDADFSIESNKKAVLNKVLMNLDEDKKIKGVGSMKGKFKHIVGIAASIAVVSIIGVSIASPSFAQDILNKVVSKISLGHITMVQEEPNKEEEMKILKEMKGKIFDKDGKAIDVFSKTKHQDIYNADGKKIVGFANGKFITASEAKQGQDEKMLILKDTKELNKHTCFKVLLPSYLPNGYKFEKAELNEDNNGEAFDNKYIDLHFYNKETGKDIFIQQRFACEETKYVESTNGDIEKIKINGADATVTDGNNINWEENNVMYSIIPSGISKNEAIKIAESIK